MYRSPRERRVRRWRWLRVTLGFFGLMLVAVWLDHVLIRQVYVGADRLRIVESKAWYQILRQAGDVRTWILLGLGLLAQEYWVAWRERSWQGRPLVPGLMHLVGRRPALVLISAAVSGMSAEVLRGILSRERPLSPDGILHAQHAWNWPLAPLWSGAEWSSFGLPSSHAAVAFGAAFAVIRHYPGAGPLALAVAAGCAWTRLLAGQHYASDCLLAAGVGFVTASALTAWFPMRAQRFSVPRFG